MRIYEYGKDEIPNMQCALAIGLFDGVHTAHRELIKRALERAKELSLPLGVFTFSSESDIKSGTRRIYSTEERLAILAECGVSFCVLSDFSSIRGMSAREFVEKTLYRELGCRLCAVGYNFRFGSGARADAEKLSEIMSSLGGETLICEEQRLDGEEISSTRIRKLLEAGEVEHAGRLLGESYFVRGYVTHGRGIGSSRLGIPTINISFSDNSLIPRLGVYTASAVVDGVPHPAVANIGACPTYGERKIHVEAHLFDFAGDLYGKYVRVNFLSFLRDEKQFDDENSLKMQIKADISAAIEKNRGAK